MVTSLPEVSIFAPERQIGPKNSQQKNQVPSTWFKLDIMISLMHL